MNTMITLVPTRGRPMNAAQLLSAHEELSTASDLLFVIDANDPEHDQYHFEVGQELCMTIDNTSRGMAYPINKAANAIVKQDKYDFFAFLGDDHRPRTAGWDAILIQAMQRRPSMAYGNDLFQGQRLPTMIAMTSDIVKALGGMVPPKMKHLYLDNFWKKLGEDLGSLTYIDAVVVEHMHPVAGKAEWDEGYKEVNAQEVYSFDALAYQNYIQSEAYEALKKKLRR
jgi:hypothetical protein